MFDDQCEALCRAADMDRTMFHHQAPPAVGGRFVERIVGDRSIPVFAQGLARRQELMAGVGVELVHLADGLRGTGVQRVDVHRFEKGHRVVAGIEQMARQRGAATRHAGHRDIARGHALLHSSSTASSTRWKALRSRSSPNAVAVWRAACSSRVRRSGSARSVRAAVA